MQAYTKILNYHLQTDKLSYGATGLLAYMLSMPSDWKFNMIDLAQRKLDRKTRTRKYLSELENMGLVSKTRNVDKMGRVEGWNFRLKPDSENQILEAKPDSENQILDNVANSEHVAKNDNPESDLPEVDKTRTGKSATTNKTIKQIYREVSEDFRDRYVKTYPEMESQIKRYFNLEAWGKAIDQLVRIDKYSLDTVKEVLDFAMNDPFWHNQVISLSCLRNKGRNGLAKFDNIMNSMKKPGRDNGRHTGALENGAVI